MPEDPDKDYKYALKCIYRPHSTDVRSVRAFSDGFVTGSRDATVKIFVPDGRSFRENLTFKVGTEYIASLCILPRSSEYPKGLILVGSNDCAIYGFLPDFPEPVLKLTEHSGTVCSLTPGGNDLFVSSSWDKTARIWSGQVCVSVLQGHKQAVWATAILPSKDGVLTGSADRTICLWEMGGLCKKIFIGHEDCVRELAIISDEKFLSSANDNTVRVWLTTGDCINILRQHSHYVYGIALLDNGRDFATCGEDQTIQIWKDDMCAQTVVLPSWSLWSITLLLNGDLVIGASDGKIYVLEKVSVDHFERAAIETASEMAAIETASETTAIESACEITAIETVSETAAIEAGSEIAAMETGSETAAIEPASEMAAMETASETAAVETTSSGGDPSKSKEKDKGERVVFYEGNNNVMYVCDYNCERGTKVKKEVLDLSFIRETFYKHLENEKKSPTVSQSGKDYCLKIEIQGKTYNLTFNKGENPWDVAKTFVANHNLLTDHVGQIVDYIIQNTAAVTDAVVYNDHFPVKQYTTYQTVYIAGLRTKLIEFSEKVAKEHYLSEAEINDLCLLADLPETVSIEQLSSLDKVVLWNDEFLYPVLDLLRICVKCKALHTKFATKEFMNYILRIFKQTANPINRGLIAKMICNMFGSKEMEKLLVDYQEKIFDSIKDAIHLREINNEKACSALFLNFAVASRSDFNINAQSFCVNILELLDKYIDHNGIYRLLQAVGTICTNNAVAVTYFHGLDLKQHVSKFETYTRNFKVETIAKLLLSRLTFYQF